MNIVKLVVLRYMRATDQCDVVFMLAEAIRTAETGT